MDLPEIKYEEKVKTKSQINQNKPIRKQPRTVYVVVELAYHDEYLSGVDIVGVFTSKYKANRVSRKVAIAGPSDQYMYRGKVYEIIML